MKAKEFLQQIFPDKKVVYVAGMQQNVYCHTVVLSNLRKRVMYDVNGDLLRWRYKPVGLAN